MVAASEPYPGRWTHHVLVTEADQIDEELMGVAAGGMGLCGEQAMRYTREELAEARRSIDSTLRKCEKALEKLRPGTSPHTLTVRRIRAFRIALALIDREMDGTEIPGSEGKEDL